MKSNSDIEREIEKAHIAEGDELHPEWFPQLYNISAAFIYRFMPRPIMAKMPEYVYVPLNYSKGRDITIRVAVAISEWNMAWEAGHLRYEFFSDKIPPELNWLRRFSGHNIYLVPRVGLHRYDAYAPLFHLLPRRTLKRFGLPLLKKGQWPSIGALQSRYQFIPRDFDSRLAHAFAYHIWPLIDPGSRLSAFSESDPIRLLAHNLDFWLPYAIQVAEARMRAYPRVDIENEEQANFLRDIRLDLPPDVKADRPFMGGPVWQGEEDAWAATREIVEEADADGRLRGILDAVRSHRVEEDFSQRWSFAREDFERKLYRKRSKVKVSFVELDDTIPVHGPESEVHENLLWEDFLAILNQKEREIVVLIRSGVTKVGEISNFLGYANHSPVSKALARIRRKALQFLK